MQIISNGIFKSPLHRVVTNTEKQRISIAMFYTPEGETEIGPADGLVSDTKPRLYKTMKSKDYLGIFFPRYLLGKAAIHLVKI